MTDSKMHNVAMDYSDVLLAHIPARGQRFYNLEHLGRCQAYLLTRFRLKH